MVLIDSAPVQYFQVHKGELCDVMAVGVEVLAQPATWSLCFARILVRFVEGGAGTLANPGMGGGAHSALTHLGAYSKLFWNVILKFKLNLIHNYKTNVIL